MRIVSWNVAGLRGQMRKGGLEWLKESNIDVVCIQETKALESEVSIECELRKKYKHRYWESCKGEGEQRKGLNGTAIWSNKKPLRRLERPAFDKEGRITSVEYETFNLVTVYTPNSQSMLSHRFLYRVNKWDTAFREYIEKLNAVKPTIMCGDFNVARCDIDVYKPDVVRNQSAGFMDAERCGLEMLLSTGYRDAYRHCHPDVEGAYTFWDQKLPFLRKSNRGWRIDYFFVPDGWRKRIKDCRHLNWVMGSDHCPVYLDIAIPRRKLIVE